MLSLLQKMVGGNFSQASALSEQRIDYDRQLLKEFYRSKSFYDAQIESTFVSALIKITNSH
jgi:outer membrane protein assembly factor BamA